MATDIVQSLFGVTPELYQQQQAAAADQRALTLAQLNPMQRAEFNIGRGAYQLAGALGGTDPQLQIVSLRQSVAQQIDPTNPESIQAGIQILKDRDPQGAMMLAGEYRKALESAALVKQRSREAAAKSPLQELLRTGKYTPQSLRAYAETGDIAQLVPMAAEDKATEAERNARVFAGTKGKLGTPEYATAFQAKFEELINKTPTANIKEVGVAENTRKPVYLDVNSNEQFVFDTDAQGKQVRKPYVGGVDRTTAKVTATASQTQERAEAGERGKLLAQDYKTISDQARVGARTLPALDINLSTLDKGFDTGFGTETKAVGARVLAALGVKDAAQFATNAQTFLANTSAAVLQRQLEQKGPQTEADAQRITQTGAQLGNTKEANRFLLSVAKAQIKRDMAQRDFYDAWFQKNKTYDGAENAWYQSEGGKSLFERPELKAYAARGTAAAQIPTAATPAAANIPQGAIDALKAGRGTKAQFDQLFGAGAADSVLGGK